MFVRILGTLQIEEGGQRITVDGARQRAVLADLLISANEVVATERLLMDMWGEDSPSTAANALQAAVSRLRRVLPRGRLVTAAPGYLLRIFPAELDAAQAGRLLFEGRDALAAGAAADAGRMLAQALSLWRGPPLADFRYEPFAQAEIARLEELQLCCLEERIEADLALGSAGALVAELQRLVSEHPVRERLRGQLMLALYRNGRQTEALQVYHDFSGVLREEMGLRTSPSLRELHAAILRHDPGLGRPATAAQVPLARRPVTVLCVLLRAASCSGAALDPETRQLVSESATSALTAVLGRYDGKLVLGGGERLLGVFGVASVHEDDALRAARASLEARSTLARVAGMLVRRNGVDLTCCFGLATGEALVGGPGPAGFAGDAGAEAVTLAEAAEPGQILIGRQTHGLAAAAIEADSSGSGRFLLRSAYAVRPLAVCLDAPLVGRDREMDELNTAYRRAVHDRTTTLVTVIGEAGLGKTRLVHEFAASVGGGANALTGRCLPYGEGITFWPLREIVRQASGGQDSPDAIRALLDGERDAAVVAERLSHALGTGHHGSSSDTAEIFWAARRLVETLARSRTLLVIFEDLHWAEPTLLDLVESLVVQPGRSAFLCVCIARPELLELRPTWAAGSPRSVSIDLEPLAAEPAAALLDALAGDQELSPDTRARLLETAAGNPLYLEQLTASLSEQAGNGVRPSLPPTIQALLTTRLQRLGPGASMVLARAAIVGKDFEVRAVRELLPIEARESLSGNLQALIAKGLVRHRSAQRYCFHHILIQQAAYHAIPKALRAELHHRFADWIERTEPDQAIQHAEIAGYHLEQSVRYLSELRPAEAQSSQLPSRAAAHLETAGRAAHDRGDALAAVNLLERAAALLPMQDPVLARLYLNLGAALAEAGQLDKARARFGDAQRIAAFGGDASHRARAEAQALLLSLKLDPSRAAAQISRALPELHAEFDRSGDELGLCWTMRLEAALHWIHGRATAAEQAWQRAATYARAVNDRRQLIELLGWLASAALWGPTPAPEGIRRCEDYLAEAGRHPSGQAVILHHLAGLYAMQDDIATARAMLSRSKELLDTLGPTMNAVLTEPAAFVAMLAGDPVAAESHLRLQYQSLSQMGEKEVLATTAALLARSILAQGRGRYAEAARLLEVSREAGADEDLSAQIIGQALEARILADRGRHADAEQFARSAVALAARTDLVGDHADVLLDLAHVLAVAGRDDGAHAAAIQARDLYQEKGNLPGVRQTLRYLEDCSRLAPAAHPSDAISPARKGSRNVAHAGSTDRAHG